MNIAKVYCRASIGIDAPLVTIEVHLSRGLPAFNLVGLAHTSVREAKERVRSALMSCGFEFPARRITVNLAPADLPKGGGRYDLAIALGILCAAGLIKQSELNQYEFLAELSLTGELRSVSTALPFLIASYKAGRSAIVAEHQRSEATLVEGLESFAASDLTTVYNHLTKRQTMAKLCTEVKSHTHQNQQSLNDVLGQHSAKRALVIAAAGGHHLLLCGPPGSGKSMLAQRLNSLLPPLTVQDALQTATIYSAAGLTLSVHNMRQRPFRQPHHTCSSVALIGGGSQPKPGEISLAHHGVLFLDELPEFGRTVLDALRQPLESGLAHIARASGSVVYPASCQLIAAMNPSPTGDLHDGRSTEQQTLRYLNRVSGPMLERFDLQVMIQRVPLTDTASQAGQLDMQGLIRQVTQARRLQLKRAGMLNAHLGTNQVGQTCALAQQDREFLNQACEKLGMSMRALHKILKIARTIADLEDRPTIQRHHVNEAMQYRAVERMITQLAEG